METRTTDTCSNLEPVSSWTITSGELLLTVSTHMIKF